MTTTNFFAEVTFGKYGYASVTGYVTMGEQRYVVEMVYREGGQKNQEVRAENLTYGVVKEFFRSDYIANGIWKRLVPVMAIAESSHLEGTEDDEPAEAINEEQPTMVNFFQCEGAISLDREYLENVADGKGEVVARSVSLPADIIDELLEANKRHWNGDKYHALLEAGRVDEANRYWDSHCKCVSAPSFGFYW